MDAGALNTNYHAKVSRQPSHVICAPTITASGVGRNISNVIH